MDPALAMKLALGDIDPVTLLPMEDINPSYMPRVLKPLPFVLNEPSRKDKGKGKAREKPATGGILSFFGWSSLLAAGTPLIACFSFTYRSKPRHSSDGQAFLNQSRRK